MAMSDCEKCWDTPCTCGWGLRNENIKSLENQKVLLERAVKFKILNPKSKHSRFPKQETDDDRHFMEFIHIK